jgi:uncharacterized membrane protein YoaT (DUF817 family)
MKKRFIVAVIAALEIVAVSFLHNNELLVFFATLALALGLLATFKFSKLYIKSFILFGALGTLAELLPVYMGAWTYSTNDLLGVAAYLPILWGSAGVVIVHWANKIVTYDK